MVSQFRLRIQGRKFGNVYLVVHVLLAVAGDAGAGPAPRTRVTTRAISYTLDLLLPRREERVWVRKEEKKRER